MVLDAPGRHDKEKFMLCPFCHQHISPIWNDLFTGHDGQGLPLERPTTSLSTELPSDHTFTFSIEIHLQWARCHNEECQQILVKVRATEFIDNGPEDSEEWFAVPRKTTMPPLDDLIPDDPFAKDFKEASLILDDSPRMSSVLSRRIVGDLLEKYAGLTDYNLATRIDKFMGDKTHPVRLRENLHYLREIGDFSAHTMKNDLGAIVDVGREEAEWTLKIVSDLFDYFIVAPEKDRLRREAVDKKLVDAGRKPIKKPTP
jgi:hypothetical protein